MDDADRIATLEIEIRLLKETVTTLRSHNEALRGLVESLEREREKLLAEKGG